MTNALDNIIREEIIANGGQIAFDRFMELALYHPVYGYYFSTDFQLGEHGDFTTAPEISPLFAQCFAKQCQQIFTHLDHKNILELGAGSGQFAFDLLTELDRLDITPKQYIIYEISTSLRKKQQQLLHTLKPSLYERIQFIETLPQDLKGIIIANEVLDALPVNCFRIDDETIKERTVGLENNEFVWKLSTPLTPTLAAKVQTLHETYLLYNGYESEINLHLPAFIASICNSLSQGVILLADYGYGQHEYYHPERNHGTLAGFYQHQRSDNPLINVGKQDITAHVDFTSVIENAVEYGCTLGGFTTQAAFLLACGLLEIAEELEQQLSIKEQVNLHNAIKILTLPSEMGDRVKIMALNKNIDLKLKGFDLQDRRRDL